jgi:hypothetical protein
MQATVHTAPQTRALSSQLSFAGEQFSDWNREA